MVGNDVSKLFKVGAIGLLAGVFLFWTDLDPEWRDYQAGFRDTVAEKFGEERAAQMPTGLQQVWVKELDRVDRCTTCHLGIDWKGLENAPNPYKSHPREILQKHPVQDYGCTSCHGGQGYAVDMEAAHGHVEHWEEPLLGAEVAEVYLVKEKGALMQMNCNLCHRYDRETQGATYINLAKQLVQAKNCRACHTINGRGGVIGPDLTYVGDKSPEQNDYSRLLGVQTLFAWHMAHLQNPKTVVPETVMPNFGLSSREAQALSLLVMSWKRADLPLAYIPGARRVDLPTPEEAEKERQMLTGPGAFFVQKGCFVCHSVSTFGIESAAKIGPDLAEAVTDVRSRFGRTLEDFLAEPTGTMSVVLATQIQLTDEEKQLVIAKLKQAYELKVQQLAQPQAPQAGQAQPGQATPGAK